MGLGVFFAAPFAPPWLNDPTHDPSLAEGGLRTPIVSTQPIDLLQIGAIADRIAAACMAEWSKAIDS